MGLWMDGWVGLSCDWGGGGGLVDYCSWLPGVLCSVGGMRNEEARYKSNGAVNPPLPPTHHFNYT